MTDLKKIVEILFTFTDKATAPLKKTTKAITSVGKESKASFAKFQSASKGAFGAAGKAADVLGKGIGRINDSVSGMTKIIGGVAIGAMTRSLFRAGVEAQQLNRGFVAITGSAESAGKELSFLREVTTNLGLEFYSTANSFKSISAAAKDTALEGAPVRDIFLGIAEASAALGMSADQTKGALNAISQMMSKGNVQAEELRGQLGERLPGAFQLAAKAMGLTTQQLNKQLELGKVLATDLLPKLATLLHEKYGKAALAASGDALQSLNRFKTAWKDMLAAIAGSGFMTIAAARLTSLTAVLKDPKTTQSIQDFTSNLFSATESLVKFVTEYKNFILVVAGSTASVLLLGKVAGAIQLLGTALKFLLGLQVVAWFQLLFQAVGSSAGALAALPGGVALATAAIAALGAAALGVGWKFSQMVNDFLTGRKELRKLAEQSDALIDKFEKFKDFKLPEDMAGKTLKEIETVSRGLHKARKYWDAMVASMQAMGETEGIEAAENQLKSVHKELEKLMDIRLFGDVSKSADKATESVKKLADNTKKLYAIKTGEIGAEYDAAQISAKSYYDVLKMKSKDLGLSDVARIHYSLFLEKAKSKEMVLLAEQEAKAKMDTLSKSGLDEKSIAEVTKSIQKDLVRSKKKFYQESLGHLQTALKTSLDLEKEYAAEVKRLKQEIADLDLSLADKIRSLRQRDMTDAERQADLALQVQEKLVAAQVAIDTGDVAGGRALAEQAGDIAYSLTDTVTAIDLLKQAAGAEKAIMTEQMGAAADAHQRAGDAARAFSGELQILQENLAGIEDQDIEIKFTADITEIEAVMSRLDELSKKGIEQKMMGGLLKGWQNLLPSPMPSTKLPQFEGEGQARAKNTVNLNLNIGGETFPTETSQSTSDALQKALGMEYLKTGGYRPSWEG